MSINRLLGGENIKPNTASSARALIGKRVEYLRERDIDKSGRGYYFPRIGRIVYVYRREVEMEGGNVFSINEFVEMRELGDDA